MAVQEKHYTANDLWEMSNEHLELVRGVPVEMAPTGEAHGIVSLWLGHLILVYVEAHDLGQVTAAETGYHLAHDPDTVRAPDVAFVRNDRLSDATSERYFPGAPDLAVEVVSPNDKASDTHDKVLEYLQAGTSLVWVVYPRSRTIAAYHSAVDVEILSGDQILDGGTILPGFQISVSEVFKKLRE